MDRMIHIEVRELRESIRQVAARMESGQRYDNAELLARRMDFSQRFLRHIASLDAVADGRVPMPVDPAASGAARAAVGAIRALSYEYSAHLQHWCPREIDADWPGYCDSARAILSSLCVVFDATERDLVPLLRGPRPHVAA